MGNIQTIAVPQTGVADPSASDGSEVDEDNEADDLGEEVENVLDLSCLFHWETIFEAVCKAKLRNEEKKWISEDCYIELRDNLQRLENRKDVVDIGFTRFCDMLSSLKLPHEELQQLFDILDYESRGTLEVNPVLKFLTKYRNVSIRDDVNLVLQRFGDCSWIPGFVDVYIDQRDDFKQQEKNILDFLLKNRFSVSTLDCTLTDKVEKIMKLRDDVIRSKLQSLKSSYDEALSSAASTIVSKNAVLKKDYGMSGDHIMPEEGVNQQEDMDADEVLVLWYVQLITATARATLSLSPELMNTTVTLTRNAMNRLMPLSLSYDSKTRPSFLKGQCLHETTSFIQLFPENAEKLELLLHFHLSTGSIHDILQCLMDINAISAKIDCKKLLARVNKVRQHLLLRNSCVLRMDFLECDCEGDKNVDPSSVLETHFKQNPYLTKSGERKATFLFKSSQFVEVSRIKVKIEEGDCGPKHGLIFVLKDWPVGDSSNLKEFSSYDNWTKSDFDNMKSKRPALQQHFSREPVAFFSTEDRTLVDVTLDYSVIGKFVLVKFLEPKGPEADHLGIVGVKFYGITVTPNHFIMEKLVNERLLLPDSLNSNELALQCTLLFLISVLTQQLKRKRVESKDSFPSYHFRKQNFVSFDQKTGILSSNNETERNIGCHGVVAKLPFSPGSTYFEIEILGSNGGISAGVVPKAYDFSFAPGCDSGTYGYHNDGGVLVFGEQKYEQSPSCKKGDKMGCGVELDNERIRTIYFTLNGRKIYSHTLPDSHGTILYPAVGLSSPGLSVRLLDSKPWRLDNKPRICKEQNLVFSTSGDFVNPKHLDFSEMKFEALWDMHKRFPDKISQNLILHLLHNLLPWSRPDFIQLENPSEILNDLCTMVDQKKDDDEDDFLVMTAKNLIADGLRHFCPCKEARLKMLFELLTYPELTGSKLVLLKSLCNCFSGVDLNAMMVLPASHLQDLEPSAFYSTMEKLISTSFQDSSGLFEAEPVSNNDGARFVKSNSIGDQALSGQKKSEHLSNVLKLFNQLQTQLLAWFGRHLDNPSETDDAERVETLLFHYWTEIVGQRSEDLLIRMKMLKESDLRLVLMELDTSILATTLPQLVQLLCQFASSVSAKFKLKLLEALKKPLTSINKILIKVPEVCSVDDNEGQESEVKLRSWSMDCHSASVVKTFSFPGTTSFEVVFDKKYEKNNSYEDCLEFTDSRGNSRSFPERRNKSAWPLKVKFENASYLHFIYNPGSRGHSDPGYKFTVHAKKTLPAKVHWLYDLYLNLSRLFGRLSGTLLDKSAVFPKSATPEDKIDTQMYESELWTTIFRGGLLAKKFERSLSGNYETEGQSDIADFILQLTDLSTQKAKVFISRCKSHHVQNHDIGGEEIDRAIHSVFVALLWHTQSFRHDISIYLRNELDGKISDGIHEAYAAAENLRLLLIEKRQKMKMELEEQEVMESSGEERKSVVDVVPLVEKKAKFLLQFAGLSKVALKSEESKRKLESRRSRQLSLSRHQSNEPVVDLVTPMESKHPSFHLVFDFVQDMAWSQEKVEELLKKRYNLCDNLWKTYFLVSECIRTVTDGHLANVPSIVFLRELLSAQSKFGRHYADGLEGCGLSMEANVRRSYYDLLRLLVTGLKAEQDKCKEIGYKIVAICTLHLLDINWHAYDLPFLVELHLPELCFYLAKDFDHLVLEEKLEFATDETPEEYARNVAWAAEAKDNGTEFRSNRYYGEEGLLARYIVAKFQKLELGTSFMCDGCRGLVFTNYYRCLECYDVDICRKCYERENIPTENNHTGSHRMVLFKYECAGCKGFITDTRWQCKECSKFNLCNGCYKNENFPTDSNHTAAHQVLSSPSPIVHQSCGPPVIKDPVDHYLRLHAWMLFSSLTFSTLDILTSKGTEQRVDDNYLYAARHLFDMCLKRAVDYLVSDLSCDDVDSARTEPQADAEKADAEASSLTDKSKKNKDAGKSFVAKVIGLISAVASANNQTPVVKGITEGLLSEKFLFALLDIARSEKAHDVQTRHMALGLLHKLLKQMDISSEAGESVESSESKEIMIIDKKALNLVQNLFSFGADCLERHGLDLAKSTSEILYGLHSCPSWSRLLSHKFLEIMDLSKMDPTMSSVFVLFAFTGFPEVLSIGTLVKNIDKDKEVIQGVIKEKNDGELKSVIVELENRKTKEMKDVLLEAVASDLSILTDNQISKFVGFIQDVIDHKIRPGVTVDAKVMWILALVVKATVRSLHVNRNTRNLELYERTFLTSLTHLVSLGTDLPKDLLLKDLEVLSLEVNKQLSKSEQDADLPLTGSDSSDEEDSDTPSQPRETDSAEEVPEATSEKKNDEVNVKTDQGMMMIPNITEFLYAEIDIEECVEEANPEGQQLITVKSSEDEKKLMKQKEESKKLMKKLLKNAKEPDFLFKVVRALAIQYARQLLKELISNWPDNGVPFSADLLGCDDIASIFFIIHFLRDPEEDSVFEKVVEKVISCCQPEDTIAIAKVSSFFIGTSEGQVVTISRRLPCHSPAASGCDDVSDDADLGSKAFKDEVHMPGATTLCVTFDESSFNDQHGIELVFASSPDMNDNKFIFTGKPEENLQDGFSIPGDHLYCVLKGPGANTVTWKFKVKGILFFPDHFDVGYLALNAILDKPDAVRSLPLDHLWKQLVSLANKSKKTKRLKTIRLLLKLLSLQNKSHGCEGLSLDLSLLAGLWHLFQDLLKTADANIIKPALLLALVELFFVAENVAQEWNVAEHFVTTVEKDAKSACEE